MRRGAVQDAFSRRDEVGLHILCMRCQVLQLVVNKPSPVESSSLSERSSCLECPPGEYLCILYRVLAGSNPAEGTTSFEVSANSASYEIDSTTCSLHDDSLAFGSRTRCYSKLKL